MDSELLTKTLNYHGQELLNALESEQGPERLRSINLQNVDYFEYHTRAKESSLQDRRRKIKLHNFIAKKADMLFKPLEQHDITIYTDAENEDLCAVMPPLESFMGVPGNERKKHFFESVKKGDIIIGYISGVQENGFKVTVTCLDMGKKRELSDLGIKVFCPLNQLSVSVHDNPFGMYQLKDLVRGVVINVVSEHQKIIISLKKEALPLEMQQKIKMGLISEEEIPSHHQRMIKSHGKTYSDVLEQTLGFNNPTTVTHLCLCLGIPSWKMCSLMRGIYNKEYPREEFAVALRRQQSAKWAHRSVKDGVAHFKAGNHTEAFQCLNKALQIDTENVEALVARGALFANNNNLRRALEDFEKAMDINPNHNNARKYMSETLVALGR